MTSTETGPSKRDTYRHGDLRRALLEAGTELARGGGPEAVVLREATRRAGVAPSAAYRHFADRLPAVRPGRAGAVSDGVLGVGQPAERRQPLQGRGGWTYPLPALGRRVPGLVDGTRLGDAPDRRSPARPRSHTDTRHRASSDRPGRTGSVARERASHRKIGLRTRLLGTLDPVPPTRREELLQHGGWASGTTSSWVWPSRTRARTLVGHAEGL